MAESPAEHRPPKRTRTEDANAGPISRSKKIWFDDGNLIVQAEQTQFRVHKGVLAKHSIFFRDLKDVPQPDTTDALVDGCPVVVLQDEAEAVEYMLVVIYDTAYAGRFRTLKELSWALQMGHKYLIPALFNNAAERLQVYFPCTLKNWPSAVDQLELREDEDRFDCIIYELYNIVKRVGLHRSLPALCFHYTDLRTLEDIARPKDSKGRMALEAEDRITLLLGRARILHAQMDYSLQWLRSSWDNPQCSTRKVCRQARCDELEKCLKYGSIVLEEWSTFSGVRKLCSSCEEKSKAVHDDGRRRFWDDLPAFFDLRPWNELTDFKMGD
ncbi:uncharacterized protein SCHCODRAFT_01212072 [Schizophyllum commune H4-8]|uniref:uncharacterized protein n=1 Tax=Schizophyllum commune (strain H4-8 / FGSC 9210) TaxID=578458 RepID=UPI00215EDEC3|nr:uncharacterized protein SCHCODRAFT_01212072 [Schizophyllum commune H4-8]KAI5896306.1 hypothetical protein SCHCODRAFT_01212072 [Schizophyllum commune H4-8]